MTWDGFWEWDWFSRDGQLRVTATMNLQTWLIGLASGERDWILYFLCFSIAIENWENPPENWRGKDAS